jgi:hypothetical protein
MQIRFAINAELRRKEFVERALLHPSVLTLDVEPHVLTEPARAALAHCNPTLPDIFDLPAQKTAAPAPLEAAQLWAISVSPNAYAAAEITEMWAKEVADSDDETVFPPNGAPVAVNARLAANDEEMGDWNPFADGTFET